jgi:DDE superfamily endonuclease
VKRQNSSTSASVPPSGGCNAFARTGLANRCRAAEALRHWRSTPNRFLRSAASNQTLHWMRSSWHCTGGEFLEAAARLSRFFARHGITVKKSLRAAERKRDDVVRRRRRWIREQGLLDPARLVFIDETAVTTKKVRPNGWSPRGERLIGEVPMGHWETLTFIAGCRTTGIVAPMLIKGAMNGEAFLAYIEQCLAPTLRRGDIVVADNVSFHKVAGMEEAQGPRSRACRSTRQTSTQSKWCSIP